MVRKFGVKILFVLLILISFIMGYVQGYNTAVNEKPHVSLKAEFDENGKLRIVENE